MILLREEVNQQRRNERGSEDVESNAMHVAYQNYAPHRGREAYFRIGSNSSGWGHGGRGGVKKRLMKGTWGH